MSTQEHIYLMTELPPTTLAGQLAPFAGLRIRRGDRDEVYLVRDSRLGVGEVGGEVYANDTAEMDWRTNGGRSLTEAFTMVMDVGYTGRDEAIQMAEARLIFGELSAAPILMALVHAYDILVAISHPVRGMIMMPDHATPDEDQRELWLPYLLGATG